MLKVSVAVCTYNGEKYIEKQLESILNQHRLPDEVIIVDDCSADLTVGIVKEFIEKNSLSYWKIVENEENLGFKENFEKALSLTTGDVCFLCDQDDIWCEDKIESGASLFVDEKIMGISSGFKVIDEFDNDVTDEYLKSGIYAFTEQRFEKPLKNINLQEIMHRNISPGCTCAYRKEVIKLFLLYCDTSLAHDYQLSAISSALSGFVYYNVPLNFYRIHSENTLGVTPLNQTRQEIAKEKLLLSEVVKNVSKKGNAFNILCKERYYAIENKKLFAVLKLFMNSEYKKYYSFKERIGDILYVLGR